MNEIQRASEKILDHLIEINKRNNDFIFVPRRINNKQRLENGYWFRGNEKYLQLTFWLGTGGISGVHQIAFVCNRHVSCYIELSCRIKAAARPFIRKISTSLGLKFNENKQNNFFWHYPKGHYLVHLDDFIANIKPKIDELIILDKPPEIHLPTRAFFDKYVRCIINIRCRQLDRGKTEMICRIYWNDKNWIKPSGWNLKNTGDSYEALNGFGHEEWLLDNSKEIDGYHYTFLQPLLK